MQPGRISARAALWPTTAGYLGNVVLPARLGEVIRIVLISRRTPVTATAATASVLIERVVDLLALLAFAAAAYGAVGAIGWLPLAGMLVLLVAFGLVLRDRGMAGRPACPRGCRHGSATCSSGSWAPSARRACPPSRSPGSLSLLAWLRGRR